MEKSTQQRAALLPEFLPGIDVQQGLINVVGNVQLFCDLLLKFCECFNDAEARLNAFLQAGDVGSALKLLHEMKGVAANLAMPELKAGIETLEQALKKQWLYEPELLAGFTRAQNRVLDSVGQLRNPIDQEIAAIISI